MGREGTGTRAYVPQLSAALAGRGLRGIRHDLQPMTGPSTGTESCYMN